MTMMLRSLTVSALFWTFACILLYAKDVDAGNGGKVHALGFFNMSCIAFEEIYISCFQCTTLVKISIPHFNFNQVISLTPSASTYKFHYDPDIATAMELPNSLSWPGMAVIVSSLNTSIAVQVNKACPGSNAGYLSIPLTAGVFLSADQASYIYFIASYTQLGQSAISIVSIYNYTCVTVNAYKLDPSFPTIAARTRLQTVTLQANDVFNMYALTDYTGVQVTSTKPVAVFGGMVNAEVPVNVLNTDTIMEQSPRADTMSGNTHILTSIAGRPYNVGFQYRIINVGASAMDARIFEFAYDASFSNPTTIINNELFSATNNGNRLAPGLWYERTAGRSNNGAFFTVVTILCSGSCMVAQYNPGDNILPTVQTLHPDPYMVVNCPLVRYTKDITFSTSTVNYGSGAIAATNYLTVIAPLGSYLSLTLDGTTITSLQTSGMKWMRVVSGLAGTLFDNYYVTSIPITDGFHVLTGGAAGDTYNAVVYGHGNNPTFPMSYGYMAGYEINPVLDLDIPAAPLPAPWYDISLTVATTQPPADMTSATPQPATPAGPAEPRPSYILSFIANFSAIDPSPSGKVVDRRCSNAYYKYFIYRINSTLVNIVSDPSSDYYRTCTECAMSGITVTCFINTTADIYFSEYSRSAGYFSVSITGSGLASLSNIYTCAKRSLSWIQDPNNWISGYNQLTTNFLRNDDTLFNSQGHDYDLSSCAKLYLSNSNGQLPLLGQNWVCPLSTTSVFGAGSGLHQSHTISTLFILLLITLLLQTLVKHQHH